MEKKKFYNQKWFIWITLFLLPPLGLILIWTSKSFKQVTSIILALIFMLYGIGWYIGIKESDNKKSQTQIIQTPQISIQSAIRQLQTYTFSDGNYISGKDFNSGTYDLVWVKGHGNVSSSNMFSGGVNIIMGVDMEYCVKEFKNAKLPEDISLKINGCTVKLIEK